LVIGQLSTGGAEGQLYQLCRGFDRAAVTATVYCLSARADPYGALLERAGIAVRVLASGGLIRALHLRRALAADRIDVVHAWLFIANAYAWAARVGGRRALITSARNCKRHGRWLTALNRRAFRASDAIIVNAAAVQHYVEREYGAPPAQITVIPNAVDVERFRPQPRTGGPRSVVTIGRLVAQKNPLLFAAAAADLHARLPDLRFVWIGDGPLHAALAAAVRAAGLEGSCLLTGERHDVSAVLQQADLFWLTSEWEGLPNVLLEAMACGLPVVATDVGGCGELVRDGVEGFLVARGDRAALVARSLEILTSPSLYARMRGAARARAETFGIEAMVRTTQALYERALARRRS
jgi:glycosyltransferase involved in cell wall biosynthesis